MGVFTENKKTIAAVAVAAAMVIIVSIAAFPGSSTGARIQISPASFDFGTIGPEVAEHSFQLKNVGGSPLDILRISTSCGCTTAWADAETIRPNQGTVLHVKFDPNAMEETVVGDVLRVVYIKSNDPQNPEIEIEIRANVLEESE